MPGWGIWRSPFGRAGFPACSIWWDQRLMRVFRPRRRAFPIAVRRGVSHRALGAATKTLISRATTDLPDWGHAASLALESLFPQILVSLLLLDLERLIHLARSHGFDIHIFRCKIWVYRLVVGRRRESASTIACDNCVRPGYNCCKYTSITQR